MNELVQPDPRSAAQLQLPNLQTERLLLRRPRPGDEEPLARIRNQPRVLAALNKAETTVDQMRHDLDQMANEAERGVAYSAVVEITASGVPIGVVRLEGVHSSGSAALNVWIDQDRPERGCGREAAWEMIKWGFCGRSRNLSRADHEI